MFSFIVASGSTRRSSFIFRQLSRSSFFAPIFKGQYTIGFDKSRKRLKGITTLPTRLFSHTNTDDDDDDDNHFRFPPLTGNVLVVGDGDFSYSVSLAYRNQTVGNANITASSLDTKDFIEETYSKGKANLDSLDLDSNVQLKHELDITEVGSLGNETVWDSIVWNLPYPPNTPMANHSEGKALMTGFFRHMSRILKPDGFIFVTLCDQQGDNGRWDLERIAWDSSLAVTKMLSFCDSNITGYVPKRAYKDEEIPKSNCRTYVIRLQNDFELKLKDKYFLELEKLAPIRREIYNTCFTPGQALQHFGKEGNILSNQLFEFYGNKFGAMQTPQIDTFKELFSIMNSELTQSLNLLSYEGHFTVEEIHTLLEGEGDIPLENFNTIYRGRFGKRPMYTPNKLVDSLKILSKIGTFYLIKQFTEGKYQYVLTSQLCTAEKVQKLLGKEITGKLAASAFSVKYEREFGRLPFPEGVKVREALEELAHSGKFLVDQQGLSFSIKKLETYQEVHNENVDCTAKKICELLKESDNGEIDSKRFRDKFEQKFGRPPFPKRVKVTGALNKLSHLGKFQLKTRPGGFLITLPK